MAPGSFGLPGYAELQCASNFTFLQGASHAEELAARAAQLGYEAIAITDECSLAGIVRAHVAAKEAGVKLLVGAHFRLTNADGSPALAFTAIAQNRDGYGNLSELVTLARTRTAKGTYLPARARPRRRQKQHPRPRGRHTLRGSSISPHRRATSQPGRACARVSPGSPRRGRPPTVSVVIWLRAGRLIRQTVATQIVMIRYWRNSGLCT
jgi:hypothetical protein